MLKLIAFFLSPDVAELLEIKIFLVRSERDHFQITHAGLPSKFFWGYFWAGFLSLVNINILGQIILCCEELLCAL